MYTKFVPSQMKKKSQYKALNDFAINEISVSSILMLLIVKLVLPFSLTVISS